MGKVIANAAVSLDGFIAGTDDAVGALFDFLTNGDVLGDRATHLHYRVTR